MELFESLAFALEASDPQEKFRRLESLWNAFVEDRVVFDDAAIYPLDQPSYTTLCTIVDPRDLAKDRAKLSTDDGRKKFLHGIAHIEYSAVDLALDAAYRFRGKPKAYYHDWLEVAMDEMRHFKMLDKLLHEIGSFYGDLPVHDALFEAAQKTQNSFLERMAIVPRFMEANGLDANPRLIDRLSAFKKEPFIQEFIKVLEIILKEEVDHVLKGDRWFSYACQEAGVDKKVYFDIVQKYYPDTFPKSFELNVEARKEAGFSCTELKKMGDIVCEE